MPVRIPVFALLLVVGLSAWLVPNGESPRPSVDAPERSESSETIAIDASTIDRESESSQTKTFIRVVVHTTRGMPIASEISLFAKEISDAPVRGPLLAEGGEARFEHLTPAEYEVRARPLARRELLVQSGVRPEERGRNVEFVIEDRAIVAGAVVDDVGLPVEGVEVRIRPAFVDWENEVPADVSTNGRTTVTDIDGRFRFDAMEIGFHRLWAGGGEWATTES